MRLPCSLARKGPSCSARSSLPALALAGEVERARATFECAVTSMNDVRLLAEEVDPATGELLGIFPQAFSHIGLVNAAWAISQAEERPPELGEPAELPHL
jgi:GH15 family glucan-1,4-alpha-glucosidase